MRSGYERRSRAIAESLCPRAVRRVAVGFTQNRIIDYAENRMWFKKNGFSVVEPSDAEFEEVFGLLLRDLHVARSLT